ncbi:MAG: hypothetical protein KCHDKBKB_01177 [Elusimicrobia bacterium]|nr:hypothetical protein [Elusimicrobiota bacterium]
MTIDPAIREQPLFWVVVLAVWGFGLWRAMSKERLNIESKCARCGEPLRLGDTKMVRVAFARSTSQLEMCSSCARKTEIADFIVRGIVIMVSAILIAIIIWSAWKGNA